MGEFKAQILGVLLVVAVFGILLTSYKTFVGNTVDQVSSKVSEVIEESD